MDLSAMRNELNTMLAQGNLGYYYYCEIIQTVLFSNSSAINYFTHIDISSKHKQEVPFEFLTTKPVSINSNYKLAISRYTVTVEKFLTLYCNAAESGTWIYDGKEVIIDHAFVSGKKFIPTSDPTGGQYNIFVPLEYGLYGSNFMGNYYIHELFSKKTILHEILQDNEIMKIQSELKKSKVNFRLDKLQDRIGNVICKFCVEVLTSTPISLGERGIEYTFIPNRKGQPHKYCLNIFQEHDGVVYQNSIDDDFDCSSVRVDPNQSETTISVFDITTDLILFCARFDYSVYSNYYSQINPPIIFAQNPNKRTLHFDDRNEYVELPNVQMMGELYTFYEMKAASHRKLQLHAEWFCKKGYMKAYTLNEHDNAIKDILSIINNNLIWDLQELWIIDPYLCADDLISTALRCEKMGIVVKALCAYSTMHNNKSTKDVMVASNFETFRKVQCDKLKSVLGKETDIILEYRTVRNGHGVPFHDRYIVLKYELNANRVWSLGASINSIGKCHSIIQIVETPDAILRIFDELWKQTENEECLLYSNSN